MAERQAEQIRRLQDRIDLLQGDLELSRNISDELEKRVQAHNSLIERTYRLEERTEIQEERIKAANHRIAGLERRVEA